MVITDHIEVDGKLECVDPNHEHNKEYLYGTNGKSLYGWWLTAKLSSWLQNSALFPTSELVPQVLLTE